MRPSFGAAVALGAAALLLEARADVAPGRLLLVDGFSDPFTLGHFGALFEVDRFAGTSGAGVVPLSSSAAFYDASDLAFLDDGRAVVVDRDADPSGLGADPNGEPGRGALFVAAAADQSLSVLADGSVYAAGLPPATPSIFVDPMGVARLSSTEVVVADLDADPSELGADSAGFAGHGALFAVDVSTGAVRLVSDGTLSADGPPPGGAASWFEDPAAVAVGADAKLHVLDSQADPLALGQRGAVFEVDVATGRLRLVAASAQFRSPAFLAALPDGSLVVSDQMAQPVADGSRGALFRVDPAGLDPTQAVTVLATHPRFRGPRGLGTAPDGSVFVADPFADAQSLGMIGTVFRWIPGVGTQVVTQSASFSALASARVAPPRAPPPRLDAVAPVSLEQGQTATLVLDGAGFAEPPEVRLGDPDLTIASVRFVSASRAEADVSVAATAVVGSRDVALVNPDLQPATLLAGLSVAAAARPEVTACAPGEGIQGTALDVLVTGARFLDGATLDLGAGVLVSGTSVRSSSELVATLAIDGAAAPGPRELIVTNPDGRSGSLASGFVVLEPAAPRLDSVEPSAAGRGARVEFVLRGAFFAPGMTLDLGPGVVTGALEVASPGLARGLLAVDETAPPGLRDATVTNADGRSSTLAAALTVAALPALRVVAVRVLDEAPGGNGSGGVDPGETISLDVRIANVGAEAATGLGVRIRARGAAPGVAVLRDSVAYPELGPGQAAWRGGSPFLTLALDSAAACGGTLPLLVEALAAGAVVAATDVDLPSGRVEAWRRKPVFEGEENGGARGHAVVLGDFDGDGVADLVVGAPGESPGGTFSAGRVEVTSGRTDDPA